MLTDEQLKERRFGIGASEVGAIINANDYMTPYKLWLIKTGRIEPDDLSQNSRVEWGHRHEDAIAKKYAEVTGQRVIRINKTLRHKKYPYIFCHLDRRVLGSRKILEIKTADTFAKDSWGPDGSDEVPMNYIAQVHQQMAITRTWEADIPVLIGGHDFRIYQIKRDAELMNYIINSCVHFWEEYVLKDMPPPLCTRDDVELAHPKNDGTIVNATDYEFGASRHILDLKSQMKELKSYVKHHEITLLKSIGSSDGLQYDGNIIATYKADKNGKRRLRIIGDSDE